MNKSFEQRTYDVRAVDLKSIRREIEGDSERGWDERNKKK